MDDLGAMRGQTEALAKDFLRGYQLAAGMLALRRYERENGAPSHRRWARSVEDPLVGNEAFWRARMYEVEHVITEMGNGREKMLLYYRYIKGESVERAADLLGVSRRTGYRLHHRGLQLVGVKLERVRKHETEVFSKFA